MNTEITGIIDHFIFQNQENGYSVLVLNLNAKTSITVTGHLPHVHAGEQVHLKGTWISHPKFGRQFEAESCTKQIPTSILGLKKYLGSGLIKGIGKVYAAKLVDHFGAEILNIIDKTPERLSEIPGVGTKRIEMISNAWHDQKEISSIMIFLQDKNISPVYATKIYKTYGKESIAILNENPYRLADDIWGVGFKTADSIAQQMGFELHSIKRIKAGICFAINTATSQGHLYVQVHELKTKTCELLELDISEQENSLKIALHELYNNDKIKLISFEEQHFVTLSKFYFAEKGVANKLNNLLSFESPHKFDLKKIYEFVRTTHNNSDIELNPDQQRGIISCFEHKVTVITGGPGTGKTTLIKKLLASLDTHKLSYKLAAPTGRASKRMFESTGKQATTIHRLLEFNPNTMGFIHDEANALQLDFLIVDEASMIDVFLMNSLLRALPLAAHIVFIGDVDQLPSVGAGNILKDMIASGQVPTTKLTHIFRQAQDSLIVVNAHKINNGEWPVSNVPDSKKDFIFIKEELPETIPNHLRTILFSKLQQYGITKENATILVPMNRGIAGTIKLNQDLQAMLNPDNKDKSVMRAATLFKINDRVMQLRNNYDKLVFNGDVGIIEKIDPEDSLVQVNFEGRIVEYDYQELDELVLAYALSIHKSQGSEYSAVIVPLFMQHFMLLQRNLIYTALTRAKKLCIFIGQPKALAMAIKNDKGTSRQTFLQQYLTTDLACR